MRWFVEVSRVGESSIAEKYCVEAKQWQAALQEARKLRGDSGALSKFSIELLDRGYRAVDPALKLRYLINEAPADAVLSEAPANGSSGKQRVAESVPPTSFSTSVPPTSFSASAAPTSFSTSVAPAASMPAAARSGSLVPRPNSVAAPRPNSVAPRAQQLLVPDDPVPAAPPLPGLSLSPSVPPDSLRPEVPAFELVRQRSEEPRAESPITYRELAFAVRPGVTRGQVEALLHDRYQATLATIQDRPPGKFVQLAVFDHVFQRRPERPPLATFAWKDWRGSPVLAFPGFGEAPMGPMSQVPPAPESLAPPANGHGASPSLPPQSLASLPLPPSLAPFAAASVPVSAPVLTAASVPVAASVVPESAPVVPMAPVVVLSSVPAPPPVEAVAAVPPAAPVPSVPPERPAVVSAAPPAAEPVLATAVQPEAPPVVAAPVIAPLSAAPVAAEPAPAAVAPASAPTFELNFASTPFNPAPASDVKSSPERASRPRIATPARRRAGEDLISELFEIMHDLHFMRDVAAGAEFVLSVLDEVLPCEGALVHVFDINTSHFVIVRAKGPNASSVLLERTSDQDSWVTSVMRAHRAVALKDATHEPRFIGPRWQNIGISPRQALCGPVQQGGRYLGMVELVNPQGDAPFHASELNALDYICEQFAEFLSKKPIVLSPDVVLAKS